MNDAYISAMRNPILSAQSTSINSPNVRRLTLEEEYRRLADRSYPEQTQLQQSNPYTDYLDVLNSLSASEREILFQTQEHAIAYAQCEELLKAEVYKSVIGIVLQTKAGIISFETLYEVTKKFQDDRINKNIQKERQLELLMQDEVVLRRLQELQTASIPQPTRFPTPQQQAPQQAPQTSQGTSTQSTQSTQQVPQKPNNYNKNNSQQKSQSSGGVD